MNWIDASLDALVHEANWAYRRGGTQATEPMALAALALSGHARHDEAGRPLRRLASMQTVDGSLGITTDEPAPHWPTGLAVLAWCAAHPLHPASAQERPYDQNIRRAVDWILAIRGATLPQTADLGHDTTLAGWPWVEQTHSWIEPTAINLLALKAANQNSDSQANHARAREAARMLLDRLLPDGGCNYGNTTVLGQPLRPHLQPSGLALAALAGEQDPDRRLERTIRYVEKTLSARTTAISLSYGLIGLAAHNRCPAAAPEWLDRAAARALQHGSRPWQLALLALASLGRKGPLTQAPGRRGEPCRSNASSSLAE